MASNPIVLPAHAFRADPGLKAAHDHLVRLSCQQACHVLQGLFELFPEIRALEGGIGTLAGQRVIGVLPVSPKLNAMDIKAFRLPDESREATAILVDLIDNLPLARPFLVQFFRAGWIDKMEMTEKLALTYDVLFGPHQFETDQTLAFQTSLEAALPGAEHGVVKPPRL
jgi:hypothetical protein